MRASKLSYLNIPLLLRDMSWFQQVAGRSCCSYYEWMDGYKCPYFLLSRLHLPAIPTGRMILILSLFQTLLNFHCTLTLQGDFAAVLTPIQCILSGGHLWWENGNCWFLQCIMIIFMRKQSLSEKLFLLSPLCCITTPNNSIMYTKIYISLVRLF